MKPESWQSIEKHFHEALELELPARQAYLNELEMSNPDAAEQVRELLNSHQSSESFLNRDILFSRAFDAGKQIGPWKILRQIGEGGMSTVYLAERSDGKFERKVAIKFLHGIMPGRERHHRILKEQQILARLQHKNIAQLLDAGITEEGRPYFILEYVDGIPVTEWCKQNKTDTNNCLNIFTQVCEAVQFAHQQLIVHRDLKPSNILVTKNGKVKLLDFGIAKLLDENPEEGGLPLTRTGSQFMTPEYASPEQVNGEMITTATDVYALGLLLCEMLTGMLPYSFKDKTPLEMGRIITGTMPVKPSLLVTQKFDDIKEPAAPRTNKQPVLKKKLKGDLDNIILKALRKDPSRRYISAEQLLSDIQNYQNNLPVSARRESVSYRAGKFIARHRVGVFAAAVIVISLFATTAISLWQAEQARAERDRTLMVNEFLQTILLEADPYTAGADATIRDVMRKAGELVNERFEDQPELEAPIRYTIGYTQLGLMELDDSYTNLKISEQMFESLYGPADSRRLYASAYLAWIDFRKGNYDAAILGYRDVIELFDSRTPWDTQATILNDYAVIHLELERYDEALELQLSVRTLWMDNAPTRQEVATIHNNLAQTYHGLLDYHKSEENYRTALAMYREFYPDGNHPDISSTLNNLGVLLRDQGNYDEAVDYYLKALEIRQITLGESHPATAFSHLNIARIMLDLGRADEARTHANIAVDVMTDNLNESHLHLLVARLTQARINIFDGDYGLAESELTSVLSLMDKEYVPGWIIEETEESLSDARLLRDE